METPDNIMETAVALTGSILTSLGFECSITPAWDGEEVTLNISGPDSGIIIGEGGSRLDDLQYLVNRLIVLKAENPPRIRVDCDNYRAKSEAKLVQTARQKAEKVLAGGRPATMGPMNAYHRRLVHSALAEMAGIHTESEAVDSRFTRITISRA